MGFSLPKEKFIPNFSKNKYEFIFALFMFVMAFFFKDNSDVKTPEILYSLFVLMSINFFSNRYLKNKTEINVFILLTITFLNTLTVFSVISFSGGINSYFWVLLLLPVFTIAMSGKLFYLLGEIILIFLGLLLLYLNTPFKNQLLLGKMLIEFFIISGGGYVIYRQILANYRLEEEIINKRSEIKTLIYEVEAQKTDKKYDQLEGKLKTIASLVHDLKNLIAIISLTSDIIENENGEKSEDFTRLKYASKMAANLSHFTLSITTSDEIKFYETDLMEAVNETVNIIKNDFKINGIRFSFQNTAPKTKIKGNKLFMERALINILLNSKSFVPQKNGTIKMEITNEENYIVLRISDNGPGFPEEILSQIGPFKSTRIDKGGTGLGLYGSYEIVKKHNGIMKIYNSNGAVVEMKIPYIN
ncbi:MAG TPA: HAMP domain-containing sensor histidine kinase [Elusimicrobiales bacterium]|nr:HAMP domain-containing sensor histidine kinase [Elusimicrobiales bacterium]HPO95391.1 HAMP domain-containing sensor histidine kinase [Elusimicrobiales bacterium]